MKLSVESVIHEFERVHSDGAPRARRIQTLKFSAKKLAAALAADFFGVSNLDYLQLITEQPKGA
jgi:hypothetical protein